LLNEEAKSEPRFPINLPHNVEPSKASPSDPPHLLSERAVKETARRSNMYSKPAITLHDSTLALRNGLDR
ncbi:MAG: hypothetical protein AAFS10_18135, partial [Myxococcota bacterium]